MAAKIVKSTKGATTDARNRSGARSHPQVAKAARAKRKQFVNKIPGKYGITRTVVRTGLGTGWYLWRGVRHTSVGAGKATVKLTSVTSRAVKTSAENRKWTPKAVAGQKAFSLRAACVCGEAFTSLEAMNRHFLNTHANDPAPVRGQKPTPSLVAATTRRQSGRVFVLLPPGHAAPSGRHRVAGRPNRKNIRAEALVKAYQSKITQIGATAVNDNGYVRTISQGFKAFGDQRPQSMTLTELRENAAGMQRALLEGAEAIESYERFLTRDEAGPGIDPAVTKAAFKQIRESLITAGNGFSMKIALIEDAYRAFVKSPVAAPRMDMTR